MKKKLLLLSCILTASMANAQTPKFEWAKQMGGNSPAVGNSITVDATGNIYTTGWFKGTVDFDPGTGKFNLTSSGSDEIFISKLDVAGNFVWAKKFGSGFGISIQLDSSGNVYTTGSFRGTSDFDPGSGIYNLTSTGGGIKSDIFISKLNSSGNFVWAKGMGGNSDDQGYSITVDKSGNVYTTGYFWETVDFNPDLVGTFNLTSNGNADIFILKIDINGNFVWVKGIGGASYEGGISIFLDKSGGVCTAGTFMGTVDFNFETGTNNLTSHIGFDIYFLKLDINGNYKWAKNIGGNSGAGLTSMVMDESGNIYSTGYFAGTADFDPGTGIFNLNTTNDDIFILKLDNAGNFKWAKNMGGDRYEVGNSIALDAAGNIYTIGNFQGTADFDPGSGMFKLTSPVNPNFDDSYDIFISKLNASGNFVWAGRMGQPWDDVGSSIALDAKGNIYTTGTFLETVDFDPGAGIFNLTSLSSDIFIHKMSQTGSCEIKENSALYGIKTYPNPTKEIINIETQGLYSNNIKIQLINSIGQLVMEETPTIQYSQFNIQHLPNGLYFVKVISDNQIIATQKIVNQ